MIQGFFGNTGYGKKEPCPICGAPDSACGGPGPMPERVAFTDRMDLRPDPSKKPPRFVAPRDIIGHDGHGPHEVVLYAKGTGIPIIVALREGVATLEDLTPQERQSLAEHLKNNPAELEEIREMSKKTKAKKRPDKDKMIRGPHGEAQVVQK